MIGEIQTNGMRSDWEGVHAKEWDSDEGAISSQSKHSITKFESSSLFVGVVLVKVDIYLCR